MFISGPESSIPSSVSNVIPDDVMLKGKARGGDIGDLASLMNLFPTRENKSVESIIGERGLEQVFFLSRYLGYELL